MPLRARPISQPHTIDNGADAPVEFSGPPTLLQLQHQLLKRVEYVRIFACASLDSIVKSSGVPNLRRCHFRIAFAIHGFSAPYLQPARLAFRAG